MYLHCFHKFIFLVLKSIGIIDSICNMTVFYISKIKLIVWISYIIKTSFLYLILIYCFIKIIWISFVWIRCGFIIGIKNFLIIILLHISNKRYMSFINKVYVFGSLCDSFNALILIELSVLESLQLTKVFFYIVLFHQCIFYILQHRQIDLWP